jgi:hypothetical protein
MKVNDPSEYIAKTESAVRKIFEGIDSYLDILDRSLPPIYQGDVAHAEDGTALELNQSPNFQNWLDENKIGSPRTAVNGARYSARDQAVESQAAPNR